MNEDAFNEWDDLKHERVLFQERMDYLATRILDGKNKAFKDALSDYLQRFDPGTMEYPESSVKTVTEDRHGTITAVFTPAGPGGGVNRDAEGEKMTPTEETIRERRRRWAQMPDSYVRPHTGAESRVILEGETQPRYSFLGQGLLAAMEETKELKWSKPHREDAMTWWAVDDTTTTLSEFYAIDTEILDRIYDLQQSPGHRREELARMVTDAPLYE